MVATRPDISPQGIYSQAEASRLLGVDRHTLARWEGLLLEPFVRKGQRGKFYLGRQLLELWTAR